MKDECIKPNDLLGSGKSERIKENVKAENSEAAKMQVRDKYLNMGKMIDVYNVVRNYSTGGRKIKTAIIIPLQVW